MIEADPNTVAEFHTRKIQVLRRWAKKFPDAADELQASIETMQMLADEYEAILRVPLENYTPELLGRFMLAYHWKIARIDVSSFDSIVRHAGHPIPTEQLESLRIHVDAQRPLADLDAADLLVGMPYEFDSDGPDSTEGSLDDCE